MSRLLLSSITGLLMLCPQALLASGAPSPALLEVKLREQVQVVGEQVRLGDLADLRGGDVRRVEALKRLPVGAAPAIGQSMQIERARLESWLDRTQPEAGETVRWDGPATVRIERAHRWVAASDVCRSAEVALSDWLSTRVYQYSVTAACPQTAWAMPPGSMALRARALPEGQTMSPRMQVWVELWSGDHFYRAVPVPVLVTATQRAWVAKRDLPMLQPLSSDQFEVKDVDVTRLNAPPTDVSVALESSRLRRALLAGQVLTTSHTELLPQVARGERVRVVTRDGAISVTTSANAMQDGRPGQQVLVRMASAAKPVAARVIGPNQVEVTP